MEGRMGKKKGGCVRRSSRVGIEGYVGFAWPGRGRDQVWWGHAGRRTWRSV